MIRPVNDHKLDVGPWLGGAALLVAAIALALAIIGLGRGPDDGAGTPAGSTAGMEHGQGGHAAAAPIDGIRDAPAARGNVELRGARRGGALEFRLEARPVWWSILPGRRVAAYAYNGIVPGPQIRVRTGERVRVRFTNRLPVPTTVHWHGVGVPNAMDGVPDVTQQPVSPRRSFTYDFVARPAGDSNGAGTFLYHSHVDEDRQMSVGLAGALIIEPRVPQRRFSLDKTLVISEWAADPATGRTRGVMPAEGNFPNLFTINGRSYPATEPIRLRRGAPALLRLVNAGQFAHPMHLHGTAFRIVARDGHRAREGGRRDTVTLESGERVDIAFAIDKPGRWILHCHIGHHMTNNGDAPGGLITVVDVDDPPRRE
jgi:FtsP/CotA-like multicopper oxidase with cupredoxin domain